MDQAPLHLSVLAGDASWVYGLRPGQQVESSSRGRSGGQQPGKEQPDSKARRTDFPSWSSDS